MFQEESKEEMIVESAFEIDREELDKTIQQLKEEKFFQKEFAKDLKKFNKLQQEVLQENKKKPSKYMNKNQLIDSYIEGELETVDFLE